MEGAILIGIGAFLTGVAGIATATASLRRSKTEAAEDCHKELAEARAEAEANAADAHHWRMRP